MTEETDLETQLKGMSTDEVATAFYFARAELEQRGIDPEDLEFVSPEFH